jgi:glycosyltransferase involved in cell wall biosynthesis
MGPGGRWGTRFARTAFLFATEADRRAANIPKRAMGSAVAEIGINVANYPANGAKPPADEPEAGGVEKQEETRKYIVCVYDPAARGRAATAIRTISMLSPRHPNLRLIIVGPGSDDEDLRMQAAALRVLHLVSFLGERDDQISLMRDAHLGWVVADGDTGAYGILDLMALAIPTVASEGGVAQRYIAHGISGALYPADDSASTAATVAGMLTSEETREAMGKAARVRVAREFPEDQMIEAFNRAANEARTGKRQKA